jgi:hypothetical protein
MQSQESYGPRREPRVRMGFGPAWATRKTRHKRELRDPTTRPDQQAQSPGENLRGLNAYVLRRWNESANDEATE